MLEHFCDAMRRTQNANNHGRVYTKTEQVLSNLSEDLRYLSSVLEDKPGLSDEQEAVVDSSGV